MKKTLTTLLLSAITLVAMAQPDPNFHIYLCFGQSNMEGQAAPEAVDKEYVDPRFKTMACVNFSNPQRTKGQWYTAYPPIVRQWTNIGMADYFGRTMVAALPSDIKVGVVDVAVGGIAIEGFLPEKSEVEAYLKTTESWLQNTAKEYDNFPYQRLVDMARKAQESGVIKGILLHQGESNNGQQQWLQKVKHIYETLLSDLNLKAEDVPLFAGETVGSDVGGVCSLHNTVIAQLPSVIPTSHVISSVGCPCASDNIHFTASGYRTMGKRYALEALRQMGVAVEAQADYAWKDNQKKIYSLKSLDPVDDITLRVGGSKVLNIWGTFADGHREILTNECTLTSTDFTIEGNTVKATEEKEGTVNASYTDFLGNEHSLAIRVKASATGPNHVLVLHNPAAQANQWDYEAIVKLAKPMEKGKTYTVKAMMKADKPADFALWPRFDGSTNRDQWGNSADIEYWSTYSLTTDWQEISWKRTAQYPHDVLIFAIGKLGGDVYIDDLSCTADGDATNMISNGDFESDDLSNWSVLGWTNQKLSVELDNASGIHTTNATNNLSDGVVYDLSGRRVSNRQLTPGIYLSNGRKFIVR